MSYNDLVYLMTGTLIITSWFSICEDKKLRYHSLTSSLKYKIKIKNQ